MRVLTTMAITAMAMMATACGEAPKKEAAAPADADMTFKGSYAQSCRNVVNLDNGYISAECAATEGYLPTKIQASLCQGDIGNNNGVLVCNGATAVDPSAPNTPAPPKASEPAAATPVVMPTTSPVADAGLRVETPKSPAPGPAAPADKAAPAG